MHGSLAGKFAELSRLSALGAGVFVTVNRTDLKGRRKENIIAVRALFVDLDGAPIPTSLGWGYRPISLSKPARRGFIFIGGSRV